MRAERWLAIALVGWGCLPGDSRPEPAEIFVTAEPSEGTSQGFTTDDGWSVRFDRFVTALGDVDLDGPGDNGDDSCNGYSETHYEWLFDFTVAGREKIGLVFGLGTCSVEYRVRSPSDDSLLGPGATQQDVELMRVRGSDAYAEDERVTLLVQGEAEQGGVSKRFDWAFRRSHDIGKCLDESEAFVGVLDLAGGDEHTLRVIVRGEELFRRAAADDAPLQFDPFAAADADADGSITLEELAGVEAPATDDEPTDPEQPVPETLADLVYELLLPRVTHFDGGRDCQADLRDP